MANMMDKVIRDLAVLGARHALLELEKQQLEIIMNFPELEGDVEIGMQGINSKTAKAALARLHRQMDDAPTLVKSRSTNGHGGKRIKGEPAKEGLPARILAYGKGGKRINASELGELWNIETKRVLSAISTLKKRKKLRKLKRGVFKLKEGA